MNKDKQSLLLGICSYCGNYTAPEQSQIARDDSGVKTICPNCIKHHRIQGLIKHIGAFYSGKKGGRYASSVR